MLGNRIVDNELLVEARPGERERGETKRMLEKELKVLGLAERVVKRIACTLQCVSAWLSGFLFPILGGDGGKPQRSSSVLCWPFLALAVAGIQDSCSGYACFRPWLLAAGPPRRPNAKTRVDRRFTRDFAALSWPESWIAVPATLVSGLAWLLAAAPRCQGNGKTRVHRQSTRDFLRYTGVLAALGSVVAGVRDSCSGYAGFWPWLLAAAPLRQGNAKTRGGSTRGFALYRAFGRAGLCRGRNPG